MFYKLNKDYLCNYNVLLDRILRDVKSYNLFKKSTLISITVLKIHYAVYHQNQHYFIMYNMRLTDENRKCHERNIDFLITV